MKRKFLKLIIWTGVLIVLLVVIWISLVSYNKNHCKGVQIKIKAPSDVVFVSEQDILNSINLVSDSVTGKVISKINIEKIESKIKENPFVLNTKVYMSLGGIINVDILQRTPVLRVQNVFKQSYYISEDGYLMPIVAGKTARVLVANGEIKDIFVAGLRLDTVGLYKSHDSTKYNPELVKIYLVASYVSSDPFWKAQIQQIFLDKKGNILLFPLVGEHIIVLGDEKNLSEKFKKLEVFIKRAEFINNWEKYDTININFRGQIICSKKNNSIKK